MSLPLLIIVMLIYGGVALSELVKGHHGMALVFFSYSLSLVGFIMEMK